MSVIISVINNKGGTGKTTTALNLGAAIAKRKKSLLLIDLDSQRNLSNSLGIKETAKHAGNVLMHQTDIFEAMQAVNNYYILPSSEKLLDYEYMINAEPGREYLLKEALDKVQYEFDYIIIDCPPSLGTLSINSLVAADYFIVPMQPENFAFIGLDKILNTAEKVKKRMNPDLELLGILMIKFSYRTKFSQAILKNLSTNKITKNRLFDVPIRQDIALMESAAFNKSVFEYAPGSRGAKDYADLANEILQKHAKKKKKA